MSKDPARQSAHFRRYSAIATLLDAAFRIPGTRWRFGLDALIGLLPGAGDVVGALFGIYGVWVARKLGAPSSLQARMLANLGVDALVGAVPLFGDLFDFAFKAQVRNRALLEHWLEIPQDGRRGRGSLVLFAILIAVLLAIVVGAVWVAYTALAWLYGVMSAGAPHGS